MRKETQSKISKTALIVLLISLVTTSRAFSVTRNDLTGPGQHLEEEEPQPSQEKQSLIEKQYTFLRREIRIANSLICDNHQYSKTKFPTSDDQELFLSVDILNQLFTKFQLLKMLATCPELDEMDRKRTLLVIRSYEEFMDEYGAPKFLTKVNCDLKFGFIRQAYCTRNEVQPVDKKNV